MRLPQITCSNMNMVFQTFGSYRTKESYKSRYLPNALVGDIGQVRYSEVEHFCYGLQMKYDILSFGVDLLTAFKCFK